MAMYTYSCTAKQRNANNNNANNKKVDVYFRASRVSHCEGAAATDVATQTQIAGAPPTDFGNTSCLHFSSA